MQATGSSLCCLYKGEYYALSINQTGILPVRL